MSVSSIAEDIPLGVLFLSQVLKTVFQSIRLPFLVLTPVCVFLGASTVVASKGDIDFNFLGLALSGGLFAHISVNALNEYLDFKNGLDLITARTPFSGGSGALPNNPAMSTAVAMAGVISLLLTVLIGVFFIIIICFFVIRVSFKASQSHLGNL